MAAKAPRSGFAKTRLARDVGTEVALGTYRSIGESVARRDGGYYRIGLNQPSPALFAGFPRSTAHVLQVTLDACKQLHFRTVTLQPLRDLDTVSDLVALGFGRP